MAHGVSVGQVDHAPAELDEAPTQVAPAGATAPQDGPRPRHRAGDAALVALPAVLTAVTLLAVAAEGPYASPDSAFYVGAARGLADGNGFSAPPGSPPVDHFPPLFALVLGGLGRLFGADPLDVAAVLNPLLSGLVVLGVAMVVRRRSGSVRVAVAAGVLFGSGLDVLVYGASALSEPLFMTLVLFGAVLMAEAITRRSVPLLGAAAVVAGAACVTRYLGIALVLAGTAAVVQVEGRSGRRRAIAFACGSLAAPLAWMLWAGSGDRPVALHVFDPGYWTSAISAVSRWVLPHFVPWPLRVAVAVAVAVALWRLTRRRPHVTPLRALVHDPLAVVLGAFAAGYTGLVLAYRLLLDHSARLDSRFLGPLHLVAIVTVVPYVHGRLAGRLKASSPRLARGVVAVGVGAVALHAIQAGVWAGRGLVDDSEGRRGLTARPWEESAVLRMVAAMPRGMPVYTNGADAVHLLTGRAVRSVPAERDQFSGRANPAFDAEVAAMRAELGAGGIVVYFRPFEDRDAYLPAAGELQRMLGLSVVATDEVAVAYGTG